MKEFSKQQINHIKKRECSKVCLFLKSWKQKNLFNKKMAQEEELNTSAWIDYILFKKCSHWEINKIWG